MLAFPKKIGKYRILEEDGCGNMGLVYSALDPFAEKTVAIKLAYAHSH